MATKILCQVMSKVTGIPIFFSIGLQVIRFLSFSRLCLHYQVFRFSHCSKLQVSIRMEEPLWCATS